MPIIIDANRAADFCAPLSNHAPIILSKINDKKIIVVIGGQLLRELMCTRLCGLVNEWIKSGRAKRVANRDVENEQAIVEQQQLLSDDPHIIALARVSNTRLIYTNDANLIFDFKSKILISPKGKVIKSTTNDVIVASLLTSHAN